MFNLLLCHSHPRQNFNLLAAWCLVCGNWEAWSKGRPHDIDHGAPLSEACRPGRLVHVCVIESCSTRYVVDFLKGKWEILICNGRTCNLCDFSSHFAFCFFFDMVSSLQVSQFMAVGDYP